MLSLIPLPSWLIVTEAIAGYQMHKLGAKNFRVKSATNIQTKKMCIYFCQTKKKKISKEIFVINLVVYIDFILIHKT